MSQAERLVALTQGTRIGSYEVLAPLGAGGMGEVYRARDTKLNRDVALKVLPDLVANDPERMARFQREAEVLASLNHPNIGQIHGLEEADGVRALVLELIEGPTLEDVIARGPMRVEEALPVARQIAAALEAAHEAGVVHRDLKPANVKVRDDGAVKVLDFGLAKALQGDAGDPSMSPTITAMGTQAGVIMGTAAYMAPEQAKGKPVDKRADIWAFGAVLFEMLTGRRAFEGDDVSEVLASVLAREPRLEAVPTTVPTSVRRLLARCLVKDPAKRLRDIGDARVELSEAATAETAAGSANTAVAGGWRLTALVGAVALVVGSASTALLVPSLTRPDPPPVSRFLVMPSADAPLTTRPPGASVAMSPDGSTLAYLFDDDGRSGLAVRRVDQVEARLLDGRRLAEPFFSPDGLSLGFVSFQLSALQRVDLTNGVVRTVTGLPLATPAMASWSDDGTIVFGVMGRAESVGLYRVAAAGGDATRILEPEPDSAEEFVAPFVLPEGRGVVFTTVGRPEGDRIEWFQPETGERRVLVDGGSGGRYVPTGHLLYEDDGVLYAVAFDVNLLEVRGEPVPVVDSVFVDPAVHAAVSDNGTLVHVAGGVTTAEGRGLAWVDRDGVALPAAEDLDAWTYPRVGPEGRRIAVTAGSQQASDIWVLDAVRGTRTRLTVHDGVDLIPEWSPDGARVLFRSDRDGPGNLYTKSSDGRGEAESMLSNEAFNSPTDWSPDGTTILYYEAGGPRNIFTLAADGTGERDEWLITGFDDHGAMFSPDGRWIVYASNESGRDEIYAIAYPEPGDRHIISTDGGDEPIWSPAGGEIFYREGDRVMVVSVQTEPTFVPGQPEVLFEGEYRRTPRNSGSRNYDVTPDGQRFLMVEGRETSQAVPIHVTLNWFEELRELVPPP